MRFSRDIYRHLASDEFLRSFVFTDPQKHDNPIVFVNQAFLNLTGYSNDEVVGINCRFLQGPDTDQKTVQSIHEALLRPEAITADLLNYRKDGSTFWNRLRIRPVFSSRGKLLNFVGIQNPIPPDQVRTTVLHGIHE